MLSDNKDSILICTCESENRSIKYIILMDEILSFIRPCPLEDATSWFIMIDVSSHMQASKDNRRHNYMSHSDVGV